VKVVITGGCGFVGLALARRLLERGALAGRAGVLEPIDHVVLFDRALPPERPAWLDHRGVLVAGNVADRDSVLALVDRDDCSVFHLASVVSYGAEQDFDLALRVNLDGSRNVLEACRARRSTPRLIAASTYAAFGGELPPEVSDSTKLTPETTYGTTKVVLELLVNDMTRKGFLDGRTARLPTVIVRPGAPNLAASSWVSAVFREPLAGRGYTLPVGLEMRTPVAGVRTVVDGLIALHDLPGERLGHDRALTFPSLAVSAGDMVESVRRVGAGRALGAIVVEPDPVIERICGSWPKAADASRALALGIPADADLDTIVREHLADAA
jgi:nucleoside-diphosphate-sugar epimerase